MQSIGMGVIGWGFMGKTHTHALREMPLFYPGAPFAPRLVSVCARTRAHVQDAMETAGFLSGTTDYREVLAREDVDVVSICTPNRLHAEMAVAALEAGKHVYIDKPLCMNAGEARRVAAAVRASGRLLQVANNNRYLPAVMRAKQLVEEGRIGEILSFRFDYLHSGSIDPARPAGWKQTDEGGVLLDLGSHVLDLAVWLMGKPKRAFMKSRVLYPERPAPGGGVVRNLGEDQAVMMLEMPNGALGTLEASKIATGTDDEIRFEIHGVKGAVRFALMQPNYIEFFDNEKPEMPLGGERGFTRIASVARFEKPGGVFLPVKNTIGWDRAHMHCYYSFLNCVAMGGRPAPDAGDALELQVLMDALFASDKEGRWVDVEEV